MGSDGSGAGTAIKDAMGSAVKSFFAVSAAIEIFKKGVELAKQFGSAVLEVGKSAEQTGAKFEAAFSPDSGVKEGQRISRRRPPEQYRSAELFGIQ